MRVVGGQTVQFAERTADGRHEAFDAADHQSALGRQTARSDQASLVAQVLVDAGRVDDPAGAGLQYAVAAEFLAS